MAGLLDFLNTPEGAGLLSAVAGGMAGARQGTPVNNIGRAGMAGLMGYRSSQDQLLQQQSSDLAEKYKKMQMDAMQQQLEQKKQADAWKAGLTGIMQPQLSGTTDQGRQLLEQNAGFGNEGAQSLLDSAQYAKPNADLGIQYGVNNNALQNYLMKPGSPYADKIIENTIIPKAPKWKVEERFNSTTGQPEKMLVDENNPTSTMPFGGQQQKLPEGMIMVDGKRVIDPQYLDMKKQISKAGASNVSTKIENKVGESIAGQVGPMLKSSVEKTTGAINLANSSRMMTEALDKNNAYVGPMANARLKLAQFGQVLGVGGKNEEEKINNTRQLIRSLAEGSVEARKELAGQGQVTESEAAAVQKAYSGNIEDLTANEIRLIAGLNIKREKLARERHDRMLKTAPEQLKPFYQIDPETPAGSSGGWGIQRVP